MLIVADSKIPHAEAAFRQFGEVRVVPTKLMVHDSIRDADAILVRSETRIDSALVDGTNIRFVGTATIGTDHVDVDYLRKKGIGFESCPGSNADSVAEYILAALLEAASRSGATLRGKTIGVVGHGNTGSRVAKMAGAIGMRVLLNDPPLARTTGDSRYVPLDALMDADILSLHVPLTKSGPDATYHLFDQKRICAMKKGASLVNASRGAVVETAALKEALLGKHLSWCVLDVWENEPDINVGLLDAVMLGTPHIAGYSYDGKLNASKMLQQALSTAFHLPLRKDGSLDDVQPEEIGLPSGDGDGEAILRSAVRRCYDINRDDAALRKIGTLPEGLRPDYFRELRSKYPVRREFHNYTIKAGKLSAELTALFASVGFTIHQETRVV